MSKIVIRMVRLLCRHDLLFRFVKQYKSHDDIACNFLPLFISCIDLYFVFAILFQVRKRLRKVFYLVSLAVPEGDTPSSQVVR